MKSPLGELAAVASPILGVLTSSPQTRHISPVPGQLHVAAWTTMFGCKGRMVEWWLGFIETTVQYKWWNPAEYLDTTRFEEAGITAAACARVGMLDSPVWAGHIIHLCRDTDYGCETRSRFWLGDVDPPELAPDANPRRNLFPDAAGEGLLKHDHEEMS